MDRRLPGVIHAVAATASAVQDRLKNVLSIQAISDSDDGGAFAAILADGSVVAWGYGDAGDCSAVQDQLRYL